MIPVNNIRAPVKINGKCTGIMQLLPFYHKIWAGLEGGGGGGGAATVHYNVVKILDYGGWGCEWEINQLI